MTQREEIQETQTFKAFPPLVKKITLKKNVIERIFHGVIVSENRGFDYWDKASNYIPRNRQIVKEIILNRGI